MKTSIASPSKRSPAVRSGPRPDRLGSRRSGHWSLRLYVAGQTPRSLAALGTLKRLCETHLKGRHDLEVIDLIRFPELARRDEIIALPTLVRRLPEPIKKVIGNLSNMERVLVAIELTPRSPAP